MKQIYDEKPEFWPYGLSTRHFDGGLWLVKKAETEDPVGFVGWQLRREDGKNVGYYSVGILPEWRRHGLAKEAVTKLLAKQASNVDVVRALIDHRNQPSQALAAALHPPRPLEVKLASEKQAGGRLNSILKALGTYVAPAAANTVLWDQAFHPEQSVTDSMKPWQWDKQRAIMGGLNALLGATGGHLIAGGGREIAKGNMPGGAAQVGTGIGTIVLSPTKDLVVQTLPVMGQTGSLIKDLQSRTNRPPSPLTNIDPKLLLGLGGAGVLGLGALGYAGLRTGNAMNRLAEKQRKGTIRVTLPTKAPGDAETQVEMPIEDVQLSENLYRSLGRDTRRRLRGESSERKRKFLTEQQKAKNLGINMDDEARITNEPIEV